MMPMPGKIFIDTNVVIYALGQTSNKAHIAAPLFVGSPSISTQVLSETANVASKRLGLSVTEIRKLIISLEAMCRIEIISLTTIHKALDIRERYNFSWYDSLIDCRHRAGGWLRYSLLRRYAERPGD
jgi:predicted nucleic acid-binding protein